MQVGTRVTAIIVAPGHGHLRNAVAQFPGDEQQLGIETPTFDGLQPENHLRSFSLECLEATLSIFKWQPHYGTSYTVEASAK